MSAQEDRIARSLKRLGFQLGKGRDKAFKITAVGGNAAPNSTDIMTLSIQQVCHSRSRKH